MKKWTKWTALLLAAALTLSMPVFAAGQVPTFQLEAETGTLEVGETVEVTLSVANNPGIGCIVYEVIYDTGLLSCGEEDVLPEKILSDGGFMHVVNPDCDGKLRVVAVSAQDTAENGPLFTLRFHALKAGTTEIRLEMEEVVSDMEDIAFRGDAISVTVTGETSEPESKPERPAEETKPEPVSPAKLSFVDVTEQDWYYTSVQYAVAHGLFSGVSADHFAPNSSMTRGMFVTVLYGMAGKPQADKAEFSDVAERDWYAKGVAWASANGIVSGVDRDKFAPNSPVTREQLALMLYQYAKGTSPGTEGLVRTFYPDGKEISDWALTAFSWAIDQGLLSGKTGNLLDPKGTATRAEAATMLMRLAEKNQ